MYIYKNKYGVIIVTNKQPDSDTQYLEIEHLPQGEGKLCTDFETVWYEPWPEEKVAPTEAPLEAKLKASNDRIEFLEDCIAEMAQIVYS